MESTETPEITQNPEEKEEKKGAGFFVSFLNKLGLGGAPGASGVGVGIGGAAGSGGGLGLMSGVLATKAGIVALIVAGTTIAAGIGVVGRNALSGNGGVSEGIYSLFPGKSGPATGSAAGQAGGANGASSSLDYMAAAAKNDPMLKEPAAPPEEPATASASADAAAPNQVAAPDNANKPANVGSARPAFTKMPGFGSGGGGGSSGSGLSARASDASGRAAANANRVGGLNAMSRGRTSAADGRRTLLGARGARASDQLKFANMDGANARGSRNPSMQAAGPTFDGAKAGQQSSEAGTPTAATSGAVEAGARDRFSPNQALDQRNVPQPKPVEKTKDSTPYKTQMYIAIGAMVVGALCMMMLSGLGPKLEASQKKLIEAKAALVEAQAEVTTATAAAALPGGQALLLAAQAKLATAQTAFTAALGEYNGLIGQAKLLAGLATACGVVATAMGIYIMTAFDQKLQGGLLAGVGGLLTLQSGMKLMKLMSINPMSATAENFDKLVESTTGTFGEAIKASFI